MPFENGSNGVEIDDLRDTTVGTVDTAFPGTASSISAEYKPPIREDKSKQIGSKRSLKMSRQVSVLNQSAEAIEKISEACQKKCKISEKMLSIEKDRSMVASFPMPGTNESMTARFVHVT